MDAHNTAHGSSARPPPPLLSNGTLGCALPANAAEQMMRTSSDIGSYADATGSQRAANLGAGSISGKSRPYTGVVLAEAPNSAAASSPRTSSI